MEALEQVRRIVAGDSYAGVLHGQDSRLALPAKSDGDLAVRWGELDGIVQ